MTVPGRCIGVGVGPGDPELLTLKAARHIGATTHIAWFAAAGRPSNARKVVADLLTESHTEHRLEYPITTGPVPAGTSYETLLVDFYDASAKRLGEVLDGGDDVVVLCEGDPFLYGSFMYLHSRLGERFVVDVVPGVASMLAGAAAAATPLVSLNETLTVLSGVLSEDDLAARLAGTEAAVVMKVGRNLAKVQRAAVRAGVSDRAVYVERASTDEQRVLPLRDADAASAPYFSLVLVPSTTASVR